MMFYDALLIMLSDVQSWSLFLLVTIAVSVILCGAILTTIGSLWTVILAGRCSDSLRLLVRRKVCRSTSEST